MMFRRLRGRLSQQKPLTLDSVQAYALWATSYPPTAHNRLMQIEQEAMLELLPLFGPLAGRNILDLACGTGRYTRIVRQAGARRVIGLDNSLAMLKSSSGVGFALGSMDRLPFAPGSFDLIVCGLAVGHLPPAAMRAAFAEMSRVLTGGGGALISDFHPFLYLSGGRRTFTAPNGRLYAVEHHPHLIADYFAAIQAAGLNLSAIREPLAEEKHAPAVLVLALHKPGIRPGE